MRAKWAGYRLARARTEPPSVADGLRATPTIPSSCSTLGHDRRAEGHRPLPRWATREGGLDFGYGFDISGGRPARWIADMGWMLGPLLIMGGLQFGATIVFIEGLPDHPDADRLWRIASATG